MTNIVFICDLYDPSYMITLSNQSSYKDYKFIFPSSDIIPQGDCVTMLGDGNLYKMKSYNMFKQNREQILDIEINKLKGIENTEETIRNLKVKLQSSEDIMEIAKLCLNITLIYYVIERMAIDGTKEENIENIIDKVSKIDENFEVTNELEMLSSFLNKQFTKEEINNMEILNARYNDEEIDEREIINKLSTHKLPQYLSEIDIRTTFDDTYMIETNLCTIFRNQNIEFTIIKERK